jgi:RNA polymerase sigma-70 factor (ECF subfamily)
VVAQTNPNSPQPTPRVDELYIRYRKGLRSFFARRARQADVDDLVQQVFMDLVRIPPPPVLQDPVSYLFQIAWNTLRDLQRHDMRRPQDRNGLSIDEVPHALWMEDDTRSLVVQEELNGVLSTFPRDTQVAIVRQFRDGWTYSQIAEELGCTVHGVKKHMSQGIAHFREYFASKPGKGSST